jgi:cold shock CspA family protein
MLGDKNKQAQFWYARQLCIANEYEEARPIFKGLAEARVPFKEKSEIRGVLKQSDGTPSRFVGNITLLRDGYGFVRCDAMNLSAFFSARDVAEECWAYLAEGEVVHFGLGFNLRGPVATRIEC